METWLEDPFKCVIAGTTLMFAVGAALMVGINGVGLFF